MAPNDWILAIDFGTSNSAAAHSGATSRGIETLPLTHTSNLMLSSVHVAGPQQIAVGEGAVNAALSSPAGFVASPKRLITGAPTVLVAGMTLPVSVPVTAVVRTIVERGKAAHAGQPPSRVVLTHPEAWSGQQIQVLIDAAAAAGIDRARVLTVSEPRAAAAHYSRSHSMQPGARIGVFDFGGGTLDVAVLTVTEEGSFQVVAARGDNGLGGKNLDALIQRWVEERIDERDPRAVEWLRTQAPIDVVQSMQDSVRRAKELLSEAPSATITVATPAGRQTLQITRDEFDELIGPAIDQAIRLTRATLLDGGVAHPDQLTALYLTGGSSRIPLVQQRLAELGPVATLDDPKTVVAQGALVVALGENAPTTADSTIPSLAPAGYLTPGAPVPVPSGAVTQPSAGSGAAAITAEPGRSWGKVAAVAVGVLAVVAVVAGVIALTSQGDDGDKTDAEASSSVAVSAGPPTDVITDQQQLMAVLPPTLSGELERCRKAGFSPNDGIEVTCFVKKSSSFNDLAKSNFGYSVRFAVDPVAARAKVIGLRNGTYTRGKGALIEDSGRTSAAEVSAQAGSSEYMAAYASTATGLMLTVYGLKSEEAGKAFVSRSGLIS